MFKSIKVVILLFLFIFNIALIFLPNGIRTRMLLGLCGMKDITYLFSNKYVMSAMLLNLYYIILSMFTMAVNSTNDYWFIQYAVLNMVYCLAALSFGKILSRLISIDSLILYIIYAILFNNIIAFGGFINESIYNIIYGIQHPIVSFSIQESNVRALGFGIGNFFKGGGISGLGIIFAVYLYIRKKISGILCTSLVLTLFITGSFLARTTIVGFIGLLLLINKENNSILLKRFWFLILIAVIALIVIVTVSNTGLINAEWAFNPILNFIRNGDFENNSLSHLESMYIFPQTIKTWIIGDGLFENSDGTYYMHTDVGYLRIIYYGGLLLLSIFIIYQYVLVKIVGKIFKNHIEMKLLYVIFLYVLILNLKGFVDFNYIFYLFIAYYVCSRKLSHKEI